ncbi:MAG TPA: hypothetical protein VHR35_03050 [Nocardioides sp.]|jgi:hypothetical protein|nr:hypothetical protein [Nocardioides sp.]
MRRSVLLALVVSSLVLSLAGLGPSASAREADRSSAGLLITYRAWGKLERGMTAKQAQKTGMVSTQVDGCAGGYLLAKPYRSRGYLVWTITSKVTKVHTIVVTGSSDHTKEGTHPGTTLAKLRKQHPHLSALHSGSALDGGSTQKKDIWVAWVKKSYGTIVYQFPYGPKPTSSTALDTIIVNRKPMAFYGC